MDAPFFHLVPMEPVKNLRWRMELLKWVGKDGGRASDVAAMCKADRLFYVNTFAWGYDPRNKKMPVRPFVMYPNQVKAFRAIYDSVDDGHDTLTAKSRDEGASWTHAMAYESSWHFDSYVSYMLASRNENLVDDADNPDSLFWKIRFLLKNLPKWLLPNYSDRKLHLHNKDMNSFLVGTSTTSDIARGGRQTAIMPDEFAAVQQGYEVDAATLFATNTRNFNSTFKGRDNAFYDLYKKAEAGCPEIKLIRMFWAEHPEHSAGLYQYLGGEVRIYDKGYPFPEDYAFIKDGKLRSIWYDIQWNKAIHPSEIANEIDMNPAGGDSKFFDPELLDKIKREYVTPPVYMAPILDLVDVKFDSDSAEMRMNHQFKAWVHPNVQGMFPNTTDYVIGVDVAAGSGGAYGSNSVIAVADKHTGEKVAEWACPTVRDYELAKICHEVAYKFVGRNGVPPLVKWERKGPGMTFGSVLMTDMRYYRVFYMPVNPKSVTTKQGTTPGWEPTVENKNALFRDYRIALEKGTYINRSLDAVNECDDYVYAESGKVEHIQARNAKDPSQSGPNHGDRVTADALAASEVVNRPQMLKVKPEETELMRRRARILEAERDREDGRWAVGSTRLR